ncbi:MAG TPA: hypothetical protein VJ961_03455 [Mariprofundaceae bacterium]|nr:hypothetical protein [Mariprofundaceae bacterium]
MQKPGTRSNISLFITAVWTILFLTVLIGGHALLFLLLWHLGQNAGGMTALARATGLHDWLISLWIAAALVMDIWILYYMRKQGKKTSGR